MHLWTMVGDWLLQARWLLSAPKFMEASSAVLTAGLAFMVWPRGCCKKDELFSRKAL